MREKVEQGRTWHEGPRAAHDPGMSCCNLSTCNFRRRTRSTCVIVALNSSSTYPTRHQITSKTKKTRMHTHLQELVRLPRPRRQILQRDVDRRDRLALDQFLLVALEDPERDAKEDVEPVHEKDVPDSKERLCWRVVRVRMSILVGMAGNVPRSGDSP